MGIKGIAQERKKLLNKLSKEISIKAAPVINTLVEAIKDSTPVDTGFARDSWKVVNENNKVSIINEAPYIDRLNAGSSKQAPALFVESAALSVGTPAGAVVEYYEPT